jgi:hypothetical protein
MIDITVCLCVVLTTHVTTTVITHLTYTHCTHTTEHPFHAHVNHVQISNVSNQYKEAPNWFVAGDWYDTGDNNGQLQLHKHQLLATVSYLHHIALTKT